MKLGKYKETIIHFICAISYNRTLFLIESPIYDLLDQRDIDLDIIADNTNNPGHLFINDLIVDCTKHIDYQKEDSFLLFHASIDALRRRRELEEAIRLINIALTKNFSSLEKSLLKQEQELCSKEDILTNIKVIEEEEI